MKENRIKDLNNFFSELSEQELKVVGGHNTSGKNDSSKETNSFGGVTSPDTLGEDLVDIYESLVFATSHIIERVANSFD